MNKKQGMPGEQPGNIVAVVGKQTGLTALVEQSQRQGSSYEFRLYPDISDLFQDSVSVQCVLIDLSKGAGYDLDVLAGLKVAMPRIPILALTDREDTAKAVTAVEKGACDFLFMDEISPSAIRLACKLNDIQAGYRSSFVLNPYPVLLLNMDGNIDSVNEAGFRLTGYSTEEMRHTHLNRYISPEDIDIATEIFTQKAQFGQAKTLPCRIVRKDGTVRHCEITGIPVATEEGVGRVHAVLRDQTDLFQARQAAEGQAQFINKQVTELNLLYAISDVMSEEDDYYAIKQKIIELIPGNLKHLGISGARLNQGDLRFTSSNFDEDRISKIFDVLSQGVTAAQLELCSESDRSFDQENTSLFDIIIERLGKLISRHRMTEELREHQQRQKFAIQAADLGYWEHDLISGKSWGSSRTAALFGKSMPFNLTLEELVSLIHPEDRDRVKRTFSNAIANCGRAEAEYRIVLPSGKVRWLHDRGQCIQDGAGRYTKMIGVVSDFTERKQADEALKTSEEIFHSTYTYAPVGIGLINRDGRWIEINQKYCDITGYSREELLNGDREFIELTDPQFRARSLEYMRQLESGEKPFYSLEKRLIRKDGTKVWVRVTASCVRDVAGTLQFYTAVIEDVTERRQAQEALIRSESDYRRQNNLLETVLGSMSEGVLYLDRQQKVVWANTAAKQIIDLAANQLGIEQWPKVYGIYLPDMRTHYPAENLPMARVLKGEVVARDEMVIRQPGQTSETWVSVNGSPLHDSAGKLLGGLVVMRDITVRKQAEYRLAYSAQYDQLTGLPNRNLFMDRLNTALCQAAQKQGLAAIIRLDIDHFMEVNEQFGQETADRVLSLIGQILKSQVRELDTVARFSGDEYLVLLHAIPDTSFAQKCADRILKAVDRPIQVEGIEICLTVSIGIAVYPEHATSASILMQRSAAATKHAKSQGRNNVQLFTEDLNRQRLARIDLKSDLRRAISNNELILHYQPQIEIGSNKIIGMEALIRWNHPDLGLIAPNQFISLAEDNGLILPISEWLIRTACKQAIDWQEQGLPLIRMATKVSALQLRQKHFGEDVNCILQETGLDAHYLDLQIKEGLLLQDIPYSIDVITELKEYGIQITLDDFGTAYSAINYLNELPLDMIRFDAAFIRYLTTEEFHSVYAKLVISLAHSLKISMMAEGVETKAQLDWLKQHQCDFAQGHLISFPLTAEEATAFLKDRRTIV